LCKEIEKKLSKIKHASLSDRDAIIKPGQAQWLALVIYAVQMGILINYFYGDQYTAAWETGCIDLAKQIIFVFSPWIHDHIYDG